MDDIKPFRIAIPQPDLDDLRDRLRRTRWAAQLPGGWSRGVPVGHLRELAAYWADGFDWRAQEARLNEFPQYSTVIDGQPIHFLHVRSPEPHAVPLIMTHSWPSSVVEFLGVIGPLTDPRRHGLDPALAFHVVAPSLPGFAFSPFPEPADERPWSVERVARTWAELMSRLGYDRYGAHGNDAGALVTPQLAALDSEHVIGSVITAGLGIPQGRPGELDGLSPADLAELEQLSAWMSGGSGYGPYLAARPQTLAHGFTDSPVAQLAYLVERFKEFDGWGSGEEPVHRDLVLANASLYWFTGTGGSSSWTYYEGAAGLPISQTAVPTGVTHGGPEVLRRVAERGNDIRYWGKAQSPSHMVGMAVPETLVEGIREFFRTIR
ncbi:Epoxide hydrolase [[Actinomadura] parvosata subsp. kistnae]|uniref:Epoxide hydrolase n=1 Tax=[Actinomadura] parvosata subsp. kistnae TaxID=1909395 RepID=A0A1V0A3E0_9ACTN|nr:epoxide hydrolase family protein [Nonomuraea sp. ATCC 55076]AQZ64731.1 epoxide hydrolase [Nonomuraea sp. ATCC 55076]SPL98522.1 Epoxide hydrolase [Actinomadura parvosata subsp. kistnae]